MSRFGRYLHVHTTDLGLEDLRVMGTPPDVWRSPAGIYNNDMNAWLGLAARWLAVKYWYCQTVRRQPESQPCQALPCHVLQASHAACVLLYRTLLPSTSLLYYPVSTQRSNPRSLACHYHHAPQKLDCVMVLAHPCRHSGTTPTSQYQRMVAGILVIPVTFWAVAVGPRHGC